MHPSSVRQHAFAGVDPAARSAPSPAAPAEAPPRASFPVFEVDSAFSGEQGLEFVQKALAEKRPYTMAFVDMRMNSGWNGIETIGHIWQRMLRFADHHLHRPRRFHLA